MAYLDGRRSEFPDKMDNLLELFNLPASLKPNAKRYKQLLTKETLSTMEKSEFNDLKVLLQDYLIDVQKFNLFGDILINMQKFFKEGVEPFVNELKNNATKEIQDRKDEVIDYMDSTTAGAIRSDIGIVKELNTENKDSLVGAVNEVNEKQDSNDSKITILDNRVNGKINRDELDEHIGKRSTSTQYGHIRLNDITKETVSLGNVKNYDIATTSEAKAGVSDIKYMTPLKVKEALTYSTPIISEFSGSTSTNSAYETLDIPLGKTPVSYIKLIGCGGNYNGFGKIIVDVKTRKVFIYSSDEKSTNHLITGLDTSITNVNFGFIGSSGTTNYPELYKFHLNGSELQIEYKIDEGNYSEPGMLKNFYVEVL